MRQHLKLHDIANTDEAWLVVDKDHWTDEQLGELHRWSQTARNYGFALSNRHFEYWLLLHFEEGVGIRSSRECQHRLREYLPSYDKGIDARAFTKERIAQAVNRGKKRDSPPCTDWPRTAWRTTVYRLVENMLKPQSAQRTTGRP